ncbi:MAG: methionyl-tRNA formyltransferase [Candidatus Buchananbacteria bacterium]|nr:methionyl-tRNA formyltransferase [Candidatus Buchananbacteria bacterium]
MNKSEKIKIIVCGTPHFAVPFFDALRTDNDFEILAVLTQPDKPMGRKQIITPPPVKAWAIPNEITVLQPEKLRGNSDIENIIRELNPDAVVVVAYGLIIPQELLDLPRLGWINVHPSLLPHHRGATPHMAAILAGDTETGVSIMQLDAKMDHGPILAQIKFDLEKTDTGETILQKSITDGASLLLETIKKFAAGEISPVAQDDTLATYCSMVTKEDARIDWTKSATEISQLIRAYYPSPIAWTMLGDKRVKIFPPIEVKENSDVEPGTISLVDDQVLATCGEGAIQLSDIQIEGKNRISALEYFKTQKETGDLRFQ